MRLRPAKSGIYMFQKPIGLLRKSDTKVILLVPEASKSQILCACGGHDLPYIYIYIYNVYYEKKVTLLVPEASKSEILYFATPYFATPYSRI